MCSLAGTIGADGDSVGPDSLLVTCHGEVGCVVHRIAGDAIPMSFVPAEDVALDVGRVPAGSVPLGVVPEDGGWTAAPSGCGYILTDQYVAGSMGTVFARFVAEYQVYGILSKEEAVRVSVVWTLEIATVVELIITAEELCS